MSARTSIELFQTGCRLADVQISPRGRDPVFTDVTVRGFASVRASADAASLVAQLTAFRVDGKRPRGAWVTVWGLPATQQFLRLPPAKLADLEGLAMREASKDIAALEIDGERASVGILIGGEVQVGAHRKREVSLVAVPTGEVRRRLQPVVDAGFEVEGVLTPALALTAVARAQHDVPRGAAAAYVAITAHATCLAIIRSGVLLFAREMPWGHAGDAVDSEVATRLESELRRSVLFFKQTFRSPVEHVVLCGDMPNLRALTAPLGTGLNVAVQVLDSLVGIDASVPEPAEQFHAEIAALRLVIATGAEATPPVNVLPSAIRITREARAHWIRLVAAVVLAVGVIAGWYSVERRGASARQRELSALEEQIARLGPEADRLAAARQAGAMLMSRVSALSGFESQGPRLARVLEVLADATPEGTVFTSVSVEARGAQWLLTVSGAAIGDDAAAGQAALNELLRVVRTSPYLGDTFQPPSLRVVAGRAPADGIADRDVPIPEWGSAVEFGLTFLVSK
jgi:Tfp pilus assembly protein PilN